MDKRNIIFIPENVEEISINYFPVSNNLKSFFRREKVSSLRDIKQFSQEIIDEIFHNNKKPFPELKQFIIAIQEKDAEDVILVQDNFLPTTETDTNSLADEVEDFDEEFQPIENINDLLQVINEFVAELKEEDSDILLGRFGANNEERVISFPEICKKYKQSLDYIAQTVTALINQIKSDIGQDGFDVMNQIYVDCSNNICPLTPQFLVYLTENKYDIFMYPPAFYIRLIERLLPKIPILPELENKTSKATKKATKTIKQVVKILEDSHLPLPLARVFDLALPDSIEIFFDAIQSQRFSLIKGDKPNEVFIELS